MEHLLLRSKCSIFHIFQMLTFQRRPKALVWSKGLNDQNTVQSKHVNLKLWGLKILFRSFESSNYKKVTKK